MTGLASDLRFAWRTLTRTPGFTAIVIAILALGIGANTAIFSVIDAVLLRPLPYERPGELVHVSESDRANDVAGRNPLAPGNFLDWRERQKSFTGLAAGSTFSFNLTGTDTPERLLGAGVTWDLFALLGVRPALGREFLREEDRPSAPRVVILSDALWRRRFAADRSVLGRSISLAGEPFTVVGVMPPRLDFPEHGVELFVPLERQLTVREMHWRGSHYLEVVGRLRPGVTLEAARSDLNRIAAQVRRENAASNSGGGAVVLPLRENLVRGVEPGLVILLGAVALVLAIACANVANLLLVRASGRARELALRRALGAGVGRLVRQLVVESVLLSLAGGAVGAWLAAAIVRALVRLAPVELPRIESVAVDGRVLAFAFVVAAATGVLFGLAPALLAARRDPREGLTASGAGAAPSTARLRGMLVVAEIALAFVLTIAAGLALQSLKRLRTLDAGFAADRLLTARITLPKENYGPIPARIAFYDRVLAAVRELPGVAGAALTTNLPLTGTEFDNSFRIEGRPPRPDGRSDYALFRSVDSDYLGVMRIPVLRGRGLEPQDRQDSEPVVVIDQAMARRWWGAADPVGRRITIEIGDKPAPSRIVGIVGDVRAQIDAAPRPTMYVPYAQTPMRSMVVVVRSARDPSRLVESVRRAVRRVDPDQPIHDVRTIPELLSESILPWRFSTTLFTAFAGLALLLSAIGVYGVISFTVAQRRRELGIRTALGARGRDLAALLLRQAAGTAALGILLGAAAALAAGPILTRVLFETAPRDPATFAIVTLLLAFVALAASLPPVRRAARVDPIAALRQE
jgi:putative ABC transport system permease protein